MSHKQVLFSPGARENVLRGATALADAVRVTLGPKSKCVLIEQKWGRPLVCNDGVTIAKQFDLKDPEENLGVQVLREAAERTGDAVGDGTTTSTLLAHAIFADGVRNVAAGASAIELKRGLERGLRAAVAAIRALSRPVQTQRERTQVATISAHNEPEVGRQVADALEKVGPEGAITVEEAKGTETSVEVAVDGGVGRGPHADRHGELRLRCGYRRLWGSGRGRDHRSDQGGPVGPGERRFGGQCSPSV